MNLDTEYADESIHVKPVNDGYLFIRWVTPGGNLFGLIKRFKKVEKFIDEKKMRGWICFSEKEHTEMHKIIKRCGGIPYSRDSDGFYFWKMRG